MDTDGPGESAATFTLRDAIKDALDQAEFGYHELSDAEAEAIIRSVIAWFSAYQHIDLLEFRG